MNVETKHPGGVRFADFETVLSAVAGVFNNRRATFASRLKQWQKMGFPATPKAGRGGRAIYRLQHILQAAILIELLGLGLTPERGIALVKHWWPQIRAGLIEAVDMIERGSPEPIYLAVSLDALSELRLSSGHIGHAWSGEAGALVGLSWDREAQPVPEILYKYSCLYGRSPEYLQTALQTEFARTLVLDVSRLVLLVLTNLRHFHSNLMPDFAAEWAEIRREDADWRRAFDKLSEMEPEMQKYLAQERANLVLEAREQAAVLNGKDAVDVGTQA